MRRGLMLGTAVIAMAAGALPLAALAVEPSQVEREPEGAVVRGPTNAKRLALVFTGDAFGEGTATVLDALAARKLKASFFVTGNFLRDHKLRPLVVRMIAEGHYVGPHSDGHLLYCGWDDRKKSLVTRDEFAADLTTNVADLRSAGALKGGAPIYFMPPYEWYNHDQIAWCRELKLDPSAQVTLVNFTPGSGSNRDYAPEGDPHFVASQNIYDDVLAYEASDPHGLNGFILLLHVGSGRKDPFHPRVGTLCDELARCGYELIRIDQLLAK